MPSKTPAFTSAQLKTQEHIDKFYLSNSKAPCCAGCDHWRWHNSMSGECSQTVPMSGNDRTGLLDIEGLSLNIQGGHMITTRDHSCGEFYDSYDWDQHQ